MDELRQWAIVFMPIINFVAIVYAAFHVVHLVRVDSIEFLRRLVKVEQDVEELKSREGSIVTLTQKMDDLSDEFRRIRDRLDKFLDTKVTEKTK